MTIDRAKLRAQAEAAQEDEKRGTPGPWRWGTPAEGLCRLLGKGSAVLDLADGWGVLAADTRFIAAARTREPALAAGVLALLARVEACEAALRDASREVLAVSRGWTADETVMRRAEQLLARIDALLADAKADAPEGLREGGTDE